jgi:hypothetical protein
LKMTQHDCERVTVTAKSTQDGRSEGMWRFDILWGESMPIQILAGVLRCSAEQG